MSERRPSFAVGSAVAFCASCGNVHFVLTDADGEAVAVTLMSPADALQVAEWLTDAAAKLRARAAGGQAKCH